MFLSIGVIAAIASVSIILCAVIAGVIAFRKYKKRKERRNYFDEDGRSPQVNNTTKLENTSSQNYPSITEMSVVTHSSPSYNATPNTSRDAYLTGIIIDKSIGGGKFGEVFKGYWNGTTTVALKKLRSSTTNKEFENEVTILQYVLSVMVMVQVF